MSEVLLIQVFRDDWTKRLQLSIDVEDANGGGSGYRLDGPKFNGSSKALLRCRIDERAAQQMRAYLDRVFPVVPQLPKAVP